MVEALWFYYCLPFLLPFPLILVLVLFSLYKSSSSEAFAFMQVVQKMLEKGSLEVIKNRSLGFFSCLFLVEKTMGRSKLVIDLMQTDLCHKFIPRWRKKYRFLYP